MSFQPVLPLSGLPGWRFLQRTMDTQRAALERSPLTAREIDYFKANIAKADTAEKLVADYRLLKVALGAFGLQGEVPKKALIRKVLEEGSVEPKAMANRLVDPRYRDLAKTFGYGDPGGALNDAPGFADKIVQRYRIQQFEEAVGAVDNDMRLALTFQRVVPELAARGLDDRTAWLSVLGDRPVREVFVKAFGLPTEFAALDVDRQVDDLMAKSERLFGTSKIADFADPELRDKAIRRFLIRRQIEDGPGALTPGMTAVSLLQNAARARNVFLSNL